MTEEMEPHPETETGRRREQTQTAEEHREDKKRESQTNQRSGDTA